MSRIEEIQEELLEYLQDKYGCMQASRNGEDAILLTDDNGQDVYKIKVSQVV